VFGRSALEVILRTRVIVIMITRGGNAACVYLNDQVTSFRRGEAGSKIAKPPNEGVGVHKTCSEWFKWISKRERDSSEPKVGPIWKRG